MLKPFSLFSVLLFAVPSFVLSTLLGLIPAEAQEPVPVKVVKQTDGWQLLRDGKPYYINGAGGDGPLKMLAQYGGNSSRVWGVDSNTKARLDEAHQNGLTIAVGIWREHERKCFDYDDPHQLKYQKELVRAAVEKHKDHPAVLVWGVGNEMEGYGDGDDPKIWKHVEELCKMIKEIDPHHPTMSVIAEIGGNRVQAIHKHCPSLDIIGINSYGGAPSLPERYRKAGGNKPYIVTEFGPAGAWEVGRNNLKTVDEIPTNQRTKMYLTSHAALKADSKSCLGSYAFLWGSKLEATSTWFGMLLEDGRRTSLVDAMSQQWTGDPVANRCPEIKSLTLEGKNEVQPGAMLELAVTASDPEDNELSTNWSLRPEVSTYITYGDPLPPLDRFDFRIVKSSKTAASIRAPKIPGLYRVYCFVGDENGGAAATSLSFKVLEK